MEILDYRNYGVRCPYCGRMIYAYNADFCPHCECRLLNTQEELYTMRQRRRDDYLRLRGIDADSIVSIDVKVFHTGSDDASDFHDSIARAFFLLYDPGKVTGSNFTQGILHLPANASLSDACDFIACSPAFNIPDDHEVFIDNWPYAGEEWGQNFHKEPGFACDIVLTPLIVRHMQVSRFTDDYDVIYGCPRAQVNPSTGMQRRIEVISYDE